MGKSKPDRLSAVYQNAGIDLPKMPKIHNIPGRSSYSLDKFLINHKGA